eukprot:g74912.t1
MCVGCGLVLWLLRSAVAMEPATKKAKSLVFDEEEEDEEEEIPSDYDGDPDEYRKTVAKGRPRADESVPKPFRVYAVKRDKAFLPFKDDKGSRFVQITQPILHEILEFLDTVNLLHVSVLNRSWRQELDNETYWACRYIQSRGDDCYRSEFISATRHGWSAKQHLLWTMVKLGTKKYRPEDRFRHQRDLWVGIMRERKRKTLEAAALQTTKDREAVESEANTEAGTNAIPISVKTTLVT